MQSGGDAQANDFQGAVPVEPELRPAQGKGRVIVDQGQHNQHRREILGEDAGQRHAGHGHLDHQDEKEVENDIEDSGQGQETQRPPGVAQCAQNGAAVVVDGQTRHAQQVDSQIQHCAVDQIFLGAEQLENGPGQRHAQDGEQDTQPQAQQSRRVEQLPEALGVPRAVEAGGQHIDSAAQADEKAGEHGDQRRSGAHGAQSLGADELTDHGQICQVEENLQQIGTDQGKTEQEYLLCQGSVCHVLAGEGRHTIAS